ncbi:hypothetical protein PB2503_11954 [Parvularcula bermudensis HTCC2503]|uniref:EamA domain-containing protein n=1 Tax=Parvularcula bermudensis (strain ATCC BAA-594 / HTCC2503 / KCTC 12087) TaxID=314260 RepID=E0TDY5_PARBH|nr:DMT family transporter [Parvularcula bermudensis]ADM10434.1 hypothetical protein PB2503_11954 [Parvularcula bermudensis HTCC2503]
MTIAPKPRDWALLVGVVILGGSAFSGIRAALLSAAPLTVAAGRLWVAAFAMAIIMRVAGERWPALIDQGRLNPLWGSAIAIGLIGYSMPMTMFPLAQLTVPSLLAGIYMAFMPIATVILAAAYADEPLTRGKMIGTALGFAGALTLIGPAAFRNILAADVVAQLMLLAATLGYAIAAVLLRRAAPLAALSFTSMMLIAGALGASLPAILIERGDGLPTLQGAAAIVYLGLFPTALNGLIITLMVRSAGAGFLGLANYFTPFAAIGFGLVLFNEALLANHLAGLFLALAGVFVAQPRPLLTLFKWLQDRRGV